MDNQSNLIYAIKEGSIVSISDVESGLKCGCICPACGKPLIARKGAKRQHHFAHHSGENCAYGYETSLHLAAKDILSKAKKMTIPPVFVHFPNSNKGDEIIYDAKEIEIENIELEKTLGNIIPDVVVYAGGKRFFVEIYVTHCVDDEKLEKIRKANISTIEIDLSKKTKLISIEELTDILLSKSPEKYWKYNRLSGIYYRKFISVAEEKEISSHGLALHVDNCPIKARLWKGKPYANYIDDCSYCKYCISGSPLLCSGKARIATVADFSIPEEERIQKSDIELQKEKEVYQAPTNYPYLDNKSQQQVIPSKILEKNKIEEDTISLSDIQYSNFDGNEPIYDRFGNRWLKCTDCGKLCRSHEMAYYGGPNSVNKGLCRECSRKV